MSDNNNMPFKKTYTPRGNAWKGKNVYRDDPSKTHHGYDGRTVCPQCSKLIGVADQECWFGLDRMHASCGRVAFQSTYGKAVG